MEHHQDIKPETLHKTLRSAPKEKGHIDLVLLAAPPKRNVQESAQHAAGVKTRPSRVPIPNLPSLAG
jgi:hypothetical protein